MTTQTDALNEEKAADTSSQEEVIDPREALAEKYEATQVTSPAEESTQEASETAEVAVQEGVDDQLDAAGVSSIDPNATFTMKLDGEEQKVSGQEIIAGFQKNVVASRRLNEATTKLKEADEILANAKVSAETSTTKTSDEDEAPDNTQKAKNLVTSILDGEEDAAVEAVEQLLDGNNSAPTEESLNANEIASQVKQQMDLDSALTQFNTEYADVMTDPHLASMTNQFLATEMQSGQHSSPDEALKAAGDATRNWMKDMGFSQETEETTTQNNRVANKQALESVPSQTASAAEAVEQPETAKDILSEMRKKRGYIG